MTQSKKPMTDHERNARRVSELVPCTWCEAPVGEPCVTPKGSKTPWPHNIRMWKGRRQEDKIKQRKSALDEIRAALLRDPAIRSFYETTLVEVYDAAHTKDY